MARFPCDSTAFLFIILKQNYHTMCRLSWLICTNSSTLFNIQVSEVASAQLNTVTVLNAVELSDVHSQTLSNACYFMPPRLPVPCVMCTLEA